MTDGSNKEVTVNDTEPVSSLVQSISDLVNIGSSKRKYFALQTVLQSGRGTTFCDSYMID